jgi:ATP adenylyltransferase
MEMKLINLHSENRRFDALLSGSSRAAYDRLLLDRGEWLVAPTLGAITSGWLLALPRRHALSFRDSAINGGPSPLSVVDEVRTHLGLKPEEIVWFEHGPAAANTVVGCGLDHAHIHILLRPSFSFEDFFDCARSATELSWRVLSASDCYARLAPTRSYFMAGSADRAICAYDVEPAGSQFFRRIVANLVGVESSWDYRQFAHLPQVEETISMFKQLESAS